MELMYVFQSLLAQFGRAFVQQHKRCGFESHIGYLVFEHPNISNYYRNLEVFLLPGISIRRVWRLGSSVQPESGVISSCVGQGAACVSRNVHLRLGNVDIVLMTQADNSRFTDGYSSIFVTIKVVMMMIVLLLYPFEELQILVLYINIFTCFRFMERIYLA